MRKILVAISAALLIALLVWLTLSSHQAEQSRREAQARELQTLTVLRATDRVLRTMQNAETGQRGFLLTRDPAFLQPLRAARADLSSSMAALREVTLNDPTAAASAKRIEELAASRMQQLDRSLSLFEKGRIDPPSLMASLQKGKQAMDALRRELAGLEAAKQTSLVRSQALADHHEALAGQWRALLTAFTVVLSVLCGAAVSGLLRARDKAREQRIKAHSEMVLEAGRHLLQSIIDSSHNAIFVKTRRGEILFANKRFHDIVSRPITELHGIPVPPTNDPEEAAQMAAADRAALERGEQSEVDLQLEVDGEPRWFSVEKNPWIRDGKIIGVIGIGRDVSEARNREAELERRVAARTAQLETALATVQREMTEREAAQESLRQLQKIESLGQLTGGIAHDFNNVLAVVISSLDTVRHQLPNIKPAALAATIETAMAGATSAADLTARLLAFARQQKLEPAPVAVNELVIRTQGLLDRTFEKQIEIKLDLDPAAGWVEVDNSQLENALVNLAVNARDAMPAGGRLSILTRRRGNQVEILIEDTGAGMTPEQLTRVFDPFFTTKEVGMGTGLGLSQVHGFVTQSGGQITIRSTPKVGTCVCIVLPACNEPAGVVPARVEQPAIPGKGELILVVEDEALVRLATQTSLEALGYRVIVAANGYEALKKVSANPQIDLLITDISMPGMDGRDLAEAALLIRPDIGLLLTTGHGRSGVALDGLPILAKPYPLNELAAVISQLLHQKKDREQAQTGDDSAPHGAAGTEALTGER